MLLPVFALVSFWSPNKANLNRNVFILTEDSVSAMNTVTKGSGISIISDKEVS